MFNMQERLNLVIHCLPFLSHASGISQAQLYKLPTAKAFALLAEHGAQLVVRSVDLKAAGKDLENELCLAEAIALQPLATIFKPQLVRAA